MKWFLDMCVVLYYIGEGDRSDLNKKTKKFVSKKGENNFLLCYYIKEVDIPKWLRRQKIIYREVLKSLKEESYKLYSSNEAKDLTPRDKKKGIKLLTIFRNSEIINSINKAERIFLYLEQQINSFLQNYIDEFVIPTGEIDQELRSHLMSFINIGESNKNNSDVHILASGIQEHNNNGLVMITADKCDWNKELLEEVNYHPSLCKKYPKLPEIKYLQDLERHSTKSNHSLNSSPSISSKSIPASSSSSLH